MPRTDTGHVEERRRNPESEDTSAVACSKPCSRPGQRRSAQALIDTEVVVTAPDTQTFLAQQAAILEQLKAEDEKSGRARKGALLRLVRRRRISRTEGRRGEWEGGGADRPYQINVNGIDFDARSDEEIRERERRGGGRGRERCLG